LRILSRKRIFVFKKIDKKEEKCKKTPQTEKITKNPEK
jgi:hypothetical protein